MELGDDGLYITAELTPEGEQVLTANPKLGVSARIVEEYARSDGARFPAAIQHVLGTLDPRIPGLGPWQAIEAATPPADSLIDLSGLTFAGEEASPSASPPVPAPDMVDLARPWLPSKEYWAGVGASHGKPPPDRGGSDEEKAGNHIADAKKASAMGMHDAAAAHLARASALTSDPATQAAVNTTGKGAASIALNAGKGSAFQLAGDTPDISEGAGSMADLTSLTDTEKQRLTRLLALPDETLDALAAGGMVISPEELEALTAPGEGGEGEGGEGDGEGEPGGVDELLAEIDAMTPDQLAALEAEWAAAEDGEQPEYEPEGEPVAAGLSAEAQFSIDLANARAEETAREMAVVTARLRVQDYEAEKRRLADLGVPPLIVDMARPLLEGTGRTVELANGQTADAGQIIRQVLTEYAAQARLLDLDVELGSPMDEPAGVADEAQAEQRATDRASTVSRFKAVTGL